MVKFANNFTTITPTLNHLSPPDPEDLLVLLEKWQALFWEVMRYERLWDLRNYAPNRNEASELWWGGVHACRKYIYVDPKKQTCAQISAWARPHWPVRACLVSYFVGSCIYFVHGNSQFFREAFKKKNRRNIWKIPYLRGGVSEGSFSICYNDTFKMHKKPF